MDNMNSRAFLAFTALFLLFSFAFASAETENKKCLVYFTAIGCPNCEATDPVVLKEWPEKHSDLVIIEYVFSGWGEDNAALLGFYSQVFGAIPAVPQLFVSPEKIVSGRLEVPGLDLGEVTEGNPCLVGNQVRFGELDLSKTAGNPLKVWGKGRLLVRVGMEGEVSSDFLRELLFTEDIEGLIQETEYSIEEIDAKPAPISGGEIEFENAIKIGNSWVLKFNEGFTPPANGGNGGKGNGAENGEKKDTIDLPFFGEVNLQETPLPVLTAIIGLADGFNPCAIFILTFLLAALVAAGSKKRIIIVGAIFIFFSGFIYFLFMAAWLNVFLIGGELTLLTVFAGIVAVAAGLINVKDFFFFKKGVSLTLPTSQKIRFTERVNNLIKRADSFKALVAGTILIAITVNLYELICTVGFPIIFTRILTLKGLPVFDHYLYLVFYNVMYVVPLAVIVGVFASTLGSKKFGVEGVKSLKLISGLIILQLGFSLLLEPKIIENAGFMLLFIVAGAIVGLALIFGKRMLKKNQNKKE